MKVSMRQPKDYLTSSHVVYDVTYYVPVFLENFEGYPTLVHDMSLATNDEQMAWSFEPYYVFKLEGKFDCKTPPVLDYLTNHGQGD